MIPSHELNQARAKKMSQLASTGSLRSFNTLGPPRYLFKGQFKHLTNCSSTKNLKIGGTVPILENDFTQTCNSGGCDQIE